MYNVAAFSTFTLLCSHHRRPSPGHLPSRPTETLPIERWLPFPRPPFFPSLWTGLPQVALHMKLHSVWPFVTALFPSTECPQGSSVFCHVPEFPFDSWKIRRCVCPPMDAWLASTFSAVTSKAPVDMDVRLLMAEFSIDLALNKCQGIKRIWFSYVNVHH